MLSTLARGGGGGGGGVIVRMARRGVGFVNVGGSRGNMFSTLLEGMTTSGEKEEYTQIRESVRALCADFPGEYWRELDKVEEYPTEFVKAMTDKAYSGFQKLQTNIKACKLYIQATTYRPYEDVFEQK